VLTDQFGRQEGLARCIANDPPFATRLQLKQDIEKELTTRSQDEAHSVTAVPVYKSQHAYETSAKELRNLVQDRVTLEIILPQIPMPTETASFEDIMDVRARPSFQASLAALRKWQRKTVTELLSDYNEAGIRRSAQEFSDMIRKYTEELRKAQYEKTSVAICSVLALGAAFTGVAGPLLGTIATVAPAVFSVRKVLQPCWKDLEDQQCFPAGVIYNAKKLRT
jgi:hypothetical protein